MKSFMLFVIGGCLIIAAVVLENDCQRKETAQRNLNTALASYSGQPDDQIVEPKDRLPVYVLGAVGGMFILGGILAIDGTDKRVK
ncbi:MAG: hypothetical protein R3E01_19755 [Pirellulaceae bacterium]